MNTVCRSFVFVLLGISASAGTYKGGSWSQVVQRPMSAKGAITHRHSDGKQASWAPDPSDLLGPYEDEAPPRDTQALFLTANNTVVTVQVGSTAALRCQVLHLANHETVSWIRHRDHHLITLGSTTHSSDDRFQVTYEEKTKDWTLHIHYAQPRDAGTYECQLNTHPPIGVLATLNVIEAIASIAGGPEMYIQVGSSVHLQCSIDHYTEPPTYVFWYQDDRMINYDNRLQLSVLYDGGGLSELRLSRTAPGDSGNYSCVPSNAQPASVVIHVITGEAPAAMQSASSSLLYHRMWLAVLSLAFYLHLHMHLHLPLKLHQATRPLLRSGTSGHYAVPR